MDTILAWLLSGFDTIEQVASWALAHPAAAAFFGAFFTAVLDRVVKLTPWRGDDSALDIIEDAVSQAYSKLKKR